MGCATAALKAGTDADGLTGERMSSATAIGSEWGGQWPPPLARLNDAVGEWEQKNGKPFDWEAVLTAGPDSLWLLPESPTMPITDMTTAEVFGAFNAELAAAGVPDGAREFALQQVIAAYFQRSGVVLAKKADA